MAGVGPGQCEGAHHLCVVFEHILPLGGAGRCTQCDHRSQTCDSQVEWGEWHVLPRLARHVEAC
jgi:hypothetical protein